MRKPKPAHVSVLLCLTHCHSLSSSADALSVQGFTKSCQWTFVDKIPSCTHAIATRIVAFKGPKVVGGRRKSSMSRKGPCAGNLRRRMWVAICESTRRVHFSACLVERPEKRLLAWLVGWLVWVLLCFESTDDETNGSNIH